MKRARGFTLLEMVVATAVMGLAVVGLLANISSSMRNASRLADYDRAALLARERMSELLLERLPRDMWIEGKFPDAEAGWKARATLVETRLDPQPGQGALERIELQVWWTSSGRQRRTLELATCRRVVIPAQGPVP